MTATMFDELIYLKDVTIFFLKNRMQEKLKYKICNNLKGFRSLIERLIVKCLSNVNYLQNLVVSLETSGLLDT